MSSETKKIKLEDRKSVSDRLAGLLQLDGNKHCADCGEAAPKWAVCDLGVFICLQCSGLHRDALGSSVSKNIKSVRMDKWTHEEVDLMEQVGNVNSNEVYEKTLPADFDRPRENLDERRSFLVNKYRRRNFDPPVKNELDYSTTDGEASLSKKFTEAGNGYKKEYQDLFGSIYRTSVFQKASSMIKGPSSKS